MATDVVALSFPCPPQAASDTHTTARAATPRPVPARDHDAASRFAARCSAPGAPGRRPRLRAVHESVQVQRPGSGHDPADGGGREHAGARRGEPRASQHLRLHRRRTDHEPGEVRVDRGGVRLTGVRRVRQHRLGGQTSAHHRGRDPLALEWVHQARGVADQQHVVPGRPGTRSAHPEPAARHRSGLGARGQVAGGPQARTEPRELIPQARRRSVAPPQREADADVGLAVRAREEPAVAREDPPRLRVEECQHGERHLGGHVAADREPPHRRVRVQHAREVRERTEGAVRTDHRSPAHGRAVARREGLKRPVRATGDLDDARRHRRGPGRDGLAPQGVVEDPARRDHPVVGVRPSGERRQAGPAAGRTHDEHVAATPEVGDAQSEVLQELNAARTDQVTACLVPRERRPVDQRHACPRAGEHERRDAPRGPGTDDDRVESSAHAVPSFIRLFYGIRSASSTPGPARSGRGGVGPRADRAKPRRSDTGTAPRVGSFGLARRLPSRA